MTRSLGTRRALAALAVAPLLASGLAACGSGSDASTIAHDPAAAVASAGLQPGDQVDPADFVQTVSDGLQASTTAHATLTMDLGSIGSMTAEGDIDYTSTPPSMAMTMKLPAAAGAAADGSMDVRLVDGILYLSMGQLTQGRYWKLDPSDPQGPLASLGLDGLTDRMDPAQALQAMGDGISKVEYVGAEDGLDHYTLTVDLSKAMAAMGAELPKQALGKLPDSMTYDVWLDDQGRLSRMRMDDLPTGGSSGSLDVTLSDWDADVDIQAPPADQVTEMPDFGSMGSSSA